MRILGIVQARKKGKGRALRMSKKLNNKAIFQGEYI